MSAEAGTLSVILSLETAQFSSALAAATAGALEFRQAMEQGAAAVRDSLQGLTQAAAATGDATTALAADAQKADAALNDLATEAKQAATAVAAVAEPAETSMSRVKAAISAVADTYRSLKSTVSNVMDTLGAVGLAINGLQQIKQVAEFAANALGVTFNAKLESLKTAFTGMLGSARAAGDYLQQLQQFANTTPFEFQDVAKAAQRFMGMGMAAAQVLPTLTDIGNAIAKVGGGSQELQRVEIAISQLVAKGKVSAQEMNQLAENGIAGWQILASATHQSIQQVMKDAELGKVSADTFLKAFHEANVGDAMSAQARTFNGAMSTITDSLQTASANAFKPLFDEISRLAQGAAQFLASAQFQQWASSTAGAVGALLNTIGSLASALGTVVGLITQNQPLMYGLAAAMLAYGASLVPATAATIAQTASTWALVAATAALDLALSPILIPLAAIAAAVAALKLAWDADFLGMRQATADWAASVKKDADSAAWDLEGINKRIMKLGMEWGENIRKAIDSDATKAAFVKAEAQADQHEKAVNAIINSQGDVRQRMYEEQAAQMLATWQEAEARRRAELAASGEAQSGLIQHMSADWDDSARHVSAFSGTFDEAMQAAQHSLEQHLAEQVALTKQQVIQVSQNMAIDPGPALQAYEKAKNDYQNFLSDMTNAAGLGADDIGAAFLTHLGMQMDTAVPEFDAYVRKVAAAGDQQKLFGLIGYQDANAYRINLMMGLARTMEDAANALASGGNSLTNIAATTMKATAAVIRAGAIAAGQAAGVLPETLAQHNAKIEEQADKHAKAMSDKAARAAAAAQRREEAAAKHAEAMAKHLASEQVQTAEILGKLVLDSDGKSTKWQQVIQNMVQGARSATEANMPAMAAVFNRVLDQMDSKTPPTMASIHATFTQALQQMAQSGPGYMRELAAGYLQQLDVLEAESASKAQKIADKFDAEMYRASVGALKSLGDLASKASEPTSHLSDIVIGTLDVIKQAGTAKMTGLVDQLSGLLGQLASTTPPTMGQVRDTVITALTQMQQSGSIPVRALATEFLAKMDEMAQGAATKMAAARAAVTDKLGDLAGALSTAMSTAGSTIQSQFKGLWDLAKQATDAGMSDLASQITEWLTQAANGTAPPMGVIRDTIVARLREAAQGGDLQLRLLAQSALQHLSEMEQAAAQKAAETSEEVGRKLHQMYEDQVKAAEQARAAIAGASQSVVQSLTQIGEAAAQKGARSIDLLVQMMPLLKQAADAHMPGVAQAIQHWMDQARSGATVSAQEIYEQIAQWLAQAQQSGDQSLALLAQQGMAHLQELASSFNPAIQAANDQLAAMQQGLQQDQAALSAWGDVVKAAQADVQDYQNQLQAATQEFNNFTNAQLQGTQAFKDAKDSNQFSQNALQLASNQLQQGGDKTQIVAGLQSRLQQLQAQNQAQESALAARVAGATGAEKASLQAQLDQLRASDRASEQALSQGIATLSTGSTADQLKKLQDILRQVGLQAQNINLTQALDLDPLKKQLEQIAHPVQELTFQQARDGALAARDRIHQLNDQLGRAQAHLAAVQLAQAKMQAAIEQDNAAIQAQQELIQRLQEGTQQTQQGMQQMTQTAQTFGATLADVSHNALAPMVANFSEGLAALPPAFDAVFGPGPGTLGYKITGHDPESFLPKLDAATRSQFALYVGGGGPWAQGLTTLSQTFTTKLNDVQSGIRPEAQGVGQTLGNSIREGIESTVAGIAAAAAQAVRSAIEAAQGAANGAGSGATGGNAPAHGPAHGASHAPGYAPVALGGNGGLGGQKVQLVGPIYLVDENGRQRQLRIMSADLEYQSRAGSLTGAAA